MDSEHAVGDGQRREKDFDTLVNLTMEDCNVFVEKLVALKFVNYKIFAEVWKEMKFSLIFWYVIQLYNHYKCFYLLQKCSTFKIRKLI